MCPHLRIKTSKNVDFQTFPLTFSLFHYVTNPIPLLSMKVLTVYILIHVGVQTYFLKGVLFEYHRKIEVTYV